MKVAVIGAGPVGCYAALRLKDVFGITPVLFDKKTKPKPCSGLFSKRILEFIPLPESVIDNEIKEVEINFGKKKVVLNFSPELFAVNRKLFDEYLLKLAKTKAKFVNTKIKKVDKAGNVYYGRTKRKFDLIIACDGALSTVRKSLSLPEPEYFLGLQFFVKRKTNSHKAITFATEHGFFWKIPRGNSTEYGIMEKPELARKKLFEFSRRLRVKPKNIEGALIPVGPITSPYDNIFLCGDAAGLCKPWSGGGIIWSFTAVEIMLRYFSNLAKASEKVKKVFEPKIKLYKKLSTIVRKLSPLLLPKMKIDTDWIF